MNEFNNRIDAQREILQMVNRLKWRNEELFGLSSKAIDRWVFMNAIDTSSKLVALVKSAGASLFFLANKSQEQVSEEYRLKSLEVSVLAGNIESEVKKIEAA